MRLRRCPSGLRISLSLHYKKDFQNRGNKDRTGSTNTRCFLFFYGNGAINWMVLQDTIIQSAEIKKMT